MMNKILSFNEKGTCELSARKGLTVTVEVNGMKYEVTLKGLRTLFKIVTNKQSHEK